MTEHLELHTMTPEQLARMEEYIRSWLSGRVRDFQLDVRDDGLVLRGHAHTYYAKQLAQHAVMNRTTVRIWANDIEVS
jgi:hypothetical protein